MILNILVVVSSSVLTVSYNLVAAKADFSSANLNGEVDICRFGFNLVIFVGLPTASRDKNYRKCK